MWLHSIHNSYTTCRTFCARLDRRATSKNLNNDKIKTGRTDNEVCSPSFYLLLYIIVRVTLQRR